MSIASEITRINTNIANSYTKVNAKGGTLPATQNSANLASAIDSIEVIEQATAEGESLSLTNTKAMPYNDYVVEGKSEQDGEPSPSNPSEIHSVADDVNLFDASKIANSSISVTDNGKTIKLPIASSGNGNVNTSAFLKDLCPKLNVGDVVYLNFTRNINPNTNNFIYLYNSSASPSSIEWGNGLSKTITQDLLNSYVILYGNRAQDGETQQIIITDFKIQKNKITPYSPYNQGTVTIKQRGTTENNDYTIQTEPLRSLPNGVKDTIEADGIHRRVGRIVLDGTQSLEIVNWRPTETSVGWVYPRSITNNKKQTEGVINNILCNKLKAVSYAFLFGNTVDEGINIVTQSNAYGLVIKIKDTSLTTANAINTYLSSNPITVQYELETETIEPLTQNQATTMLDIIKTGSYEGTTNIYTDEDVKPTMKVDYYKKS